ncbi:MAG: aminotransferase, partial [Lautropia sp.]|nr:aminotransferase [Lautropia sp.]
MPAHDFSTNVNAVGPCPAVLAVLQQLVPDTYPDPAYTDLRARLGDWHGVDPERILIGASGSELISRLTAAFHRIHHLPPRAPPH